MRSFYEINVLWFPNPGFMQRHPDLVAHQIDAAVANNPSNTALIRQNQADLEHEALERLARGPDGFRGALLVEAQRRLQCVSMPGGRSGNPEQPLLRRE